MSKPSVIVEGNRVVIYKSRKPTRDEKKRDPTALSHCTAVTVEFSQGKPKIVVNETLCS